MFIYLKIEMVHFFSDNILNIVLKSNPHEDRFSSTANQKKET